jgi:hypothetical protein
MSALSRYYLICFFSFLLFHSTGQAQQKTIRTAINVPSGFQRMDYPEGSFSNWLQNVPLKKDNNIVSYNGTPVNKRIYQVWAVADIPLLFKSDIEQCADFCMRLWAEYHKEKKMMNDLFLFDYGGSKKYFKDQKKDYRGFLQQAFSFSNSSSLKKGCKEVKIPDLQPGDMFVQNETGGIGHVSMIVDVCSNKEGKKLFLVGYSFMPAQEFHIEKARDEYGISGWFTYEGYLKYLDKYLDYGKPVMKRF